MSSIPLSLSAEAAVAAAAPHIKLHDRALTQNLVYIHTSGKGYPVGTSVKDILEEENGDTLIVMKPSSDGTVLQATLMTYKPSSPNPPAGVFSVVTRNRSLLQHNDVVFGKRNHEDVEYEEKKIANLQSQLQKHKDYQKRHLLEAEASPEFRELLMVWVNIEQRLALGVEDEIDDRRKRIQTMVPGLTSSPYFTHEDIDSEQWFKKLSCKSAGEVKKGNPSIIVQESDASALFGDPVETAAMPLKLRSAIRFSSFRFICRTSICPPEDDDVGNNTVGWLVTQPESKFQWSFFQLMIAAGGNQDQLTWQTEDKSDSQAQLREDLRGFIQDRKVSSAELKKKLSQSLTGNAEGLGQIGRYGARDCKQGDYYSVLSSLSYCLFVRVKYKNENEVERFQVYPPISHVHLLSTLLESDIDHVDQDAMFLQKILPATTPPAFESLVRLSDSICMTQQVPITMPVVYLRIPIKNSPTTNAASSSSGEETVWTLTNPRVLHQTLRSLIIGVDHFDPTIGRQVVIKVSAEKLVSQEELIHHHIDGKVHGIVRAIGRVRITGGCNELSGLVLDPLCDPIDKLLVSQVDHFVDEAAKVLKELHSAGVWHRDVKVN